MLVQMKNRLEILVQNYKMTYTTTRDGGSAENVSLEGSNLVEQRRSSCRGAIFCRPKADIRSLIIF